MDATSTSRYTPSTSTIQVGSQRNVPVLFPRDLAAAYNSRNLQNFTDGRTNIQKRRAPSMSVGLPKVINGEGMLRRIGDDGPVIVDQPMEHAPYVSEADEVVPDRKDAPPPPPLSYMMLPKEFVNHFHADFFRVDMNTLDILSKHIREKVDYISKAAAIYPRHPGFEDENYNAFERNLEVIRQAGEYFEPMLGFEDDKQFYPNATSAMGTALTICIQNNTAIVSFYI
uniref:Uncharacterized protein n=1 Tax=Panagrellus redivivus TaxID=6233 RepID=A0A7E4VEK2_PANRE